MKKISSLILCVLVLASSIAVVEIFETSASPSGEEALWAPIPITNVYELQNMKSNPSANYYLANDIDCSDTVNWDSGAGFVPIASFSGTLDGKGHKINDLYINRPSDYTIGLFKMILKGGSLTNIHLRDCNITGWYGVGTLAGSNRGVISMCSATGLVNGTDTIIGGLVSVNQGYGYSFHDRVFPYKYGVITKSYSEVKVVSTGPGIVGGLVGWNEWAWIDQSYCSGDVNVSGDVVGGLVGANMEGGKISDCFSSSPTTGGINIGGLVGYSDGFVFNCYSTGLVNGGGGGGGLIGRDDNTVIGCYWDNETSGLTVSDGGIGRNTTEMKKTSTFADAGWDLHDTWFSVDGMTYPYLRAFGGNGSQEQPYIIDDVEGLQEVNSDLTAYYALAQNIDASSTSQLDGGAGFMPIGNSSDPFTGGFYGNYHKITDLYINRSASDYIGLFGHVGPGSVIYHLGLKNVNITGYNHTSGLAGLFNGSYIAQCYASGSVIGNAYVGGLVGSNKGSIEDSYSDCSVNGTEKLGGLVGYNNGTINRTYSSGAVESVGAEIGGLIGNDTGMVSNSFWDNVTSGQTTSAGGAGVVGKNTTAMKNQSTFMSAGWDFNHIWGIFNNVTYPWLCWERIPVLVYSLDDLQNLTKDLNGNYKLANDIDASASKTWNSGAGFLPIGNSSSPFNGTFEGSGYKITGLYINRSSMNNVGLFGCTGSGCSITNIVLESIIINGSSNVGALVGFSSGYSITNCSSKGSVLGYVNNTGGLIGYNNYCYIENSYSTADVNGKNYTGGLIGRNDNGTLRDSYSEGAVTGSMYVGGLIGFYFVDSHYEEISDCYKTGNVLSTGDFTGGLIGATKTINNGHYKILDSYCTSYVNGKSYVGGVIGGTMSTNQQIQNEIINSYYYNYYWNNNNIKAEGSYAGGLVGYASYLDIDKCRSGTYWDIYLPYTMEHLGGLVGYYNNGTIKRSYCNPDWPSRITGHNYTGGLVGSLGQYGTIEYSSSSYITRGYLYFGGLVGHSRGDIKNSAAYGNVWGDPGLGSDYFGGLVGCNRGVIDKCYSRGIVVLIPGHHVGGLVGWNDWFVWDSFWDIEASGISQSAGGTAKTTAQMKTASTFTDAGWDFENIWGIYEGRSYPWFRWYQTPRYIYSLEDLQNVPKYPYGEYYLANDIDCSDTVNWNSGAGFEPLGSESEPFTGKFYGNGHTINNLYINRISSKNVGLFGCTGEGSLISGVHLENCDVSGENLGDSLVGYWRMDEAAWDGTTGEVQDSSGNNNHGTAMNGANTTASGRFERGGLFDGIDDYVDCGNDPGLGPVNEITVSAWVKFNNVSGSFPQIVARGNNVEGWNLYSNSNLDYKLSFILLEDGGTWGDAWAISSITPQVDTWYHVVGVYNGSYVKIYVNGMLAGEDTSVLGSGIDYVGYTTTYIGKKGSGNYFNGTIDDVHIYSRALTNDEIVGMYSGRISTGGLVGCNIGTIEKSYSTGSVFGTSKVGGLAGANLGTITECYTEASVTAVHDSIGGFVGYNTNEIENCYSKGDVSSTGNKVGGFAGENIGVVNDCYSTGIVTGTYQVGGLIGNNTGTADSSFWDNETSNQINSDGGTGKNTLEMMQVSTFDNAGWNLTDIWLVLEGLDYPYLRAFKGDGSASRPYLIKDVFDLQDINLNLSACYALDCDIDASITTTWNSDYGFESLGTSSNPFTGTLYGRGYTISNLYINRTATDYVGLFGFTNPESRIINVSMVNCTVNGISSDNGLVGYWKLNEESWSGVPNEVVDVSESQFHGTSYGDASSVAEGRFGRAGSFDGDGDYVEVPYNASLNPDAFTISLWAKVEGGAGTWRTALWSRDNSPRSGYNIYAGADDNWQFWIGDGSIWLSVLGDAIVLNKWTHITAVYTGTQMLFYNDGVLVGGPLGTGFANNTEKPFRIGTGMDAVTGGPVYNFSGKISEVRVYNRTLSSGEILDIYNGLAPSTGALVGFNNGSTIDCCYTEGTVQGSLHVGGLVGSNWGYINNSYSLCSVTGTNYVGGLVGYNNGSINTTYSAGGVSGNNIVGGLVGHNFGTVEGSFWDNETSGQSVSAGGTGKSTTDMKIMSTFTNSGWNFTNIWTIRENYSYPYFKYHSWADPPMIITVNVEMAWEEILYEVVYEAIDNDYDSISWTISTNASWLAFNYTSHALSGTPIQDDVGSYWVDIVVQDDYGNIESTSFTITVFNVNDRPNITTPNTVTATEDVPYSVDYDAVDIDPTNDILSWSLSTNSTTNWLSIDSSTGVLSGTPSDEDVGVIWVNVTVDDGNGGFDSANFSLEVFNINDAPVITPDDIVTATEDVLYEVDYNVTDADPTNDTLTWTFASNATWLNFNDTTGMLNGTPTNDAVGWYWVNVSVDDGKGGYDWHDFNLTVNNVNDPPTIITENVTTATEEILYSVDYEATDIDPTNDTLTWTFASNATWLSFNVTTSLLNGTPTNDDVGWYWVNVTVDDGNGGKFSQNFTISVSNVNDWPVITTTDVNTALEDELYSVIYNAEDIDPIPDTLTSSMSTDASWLDFDTSSGLLSGTPTNDDVGEYWVNITVDDGNSGLDWHNFTLTVINVNDPPTILTGDMKGATAGELYSVDYDAEDIDMPGDILTWSLTTDASIWLDIDSSTGILEGTPDASDTGSFWVNVTVDDGNGGLDWHNFTLAVYSIANQPPEITTTDVTTAVVGRSYSVTYEATDDHTAVVDLVWAWATNADWLEFDTITYELSGTPTEADVGSYWVYISVADYEGELDFHNFTLEVRLTNSVPVLTDGQITPASGDIKTEFTFSVIYTDADNDIGTVWVWIDGTQHEMTPDPDDTDFTDGVEYTYKTKLSKGEHTCYFTAVDVIDDATAGDDTPISVDDALSAPKVTEAEEKGAFEDWMLYLVLLIVIIIVILILVFVMSRRKPPEEELLAAEEEGEGETEEEASEEELTPEEEFEEGEIEEEITEEELTPEEEFEEGEIEEEVSEEELTPEEEFEEGELEEEMSEEELTPEEELEEGELEEEISDEELTPEDELEEGEK